MPSIDIIHYTRPAVTRVEQAAITFTPEEFDLLQYALREATASLFKQARSIQRRDARLAECVFRDIDRFDHLGVELNRRRWNDRND